VTVEKYRAQRSPLFPGSERWPSDTDTSVMTSKRCTERSELQMCRRENHAFPIPPFSTLYRALNISSTARGKNRPSFFNAAIIARKVKSTYFAKWHR